MSNIIVSGYYGFKNAGDEAMLAAMIEVLLELEPECKITVISANPADTKVRHGVDAVYWLNYVQIAAVVRKSDLLISGGGSLLQNVTSWRSLYYYMSILFLAKSLGTPVMLYAQGIGPIYGQFAREVMHRIGNMVNLITVRDVGSLHELERLRIDRPMIRVTADPVLAIHRVDREIGHKILKQHGVGGAKPLVGISVREWRGWDHYKDVLAQAAEVISAELGARIVFLPMQYPEDIAAAKLIAAKASCDTVVLDDEYTTSELLSLVGNCQLLIGIRLHALIFAGVMGVPMIGLSYDPKIDRFLDSIGEKTVADLENISVASLLACVREKWGKIKRDDVNDELLAGLRKAAFYNAELALTLIADSKAMR